MQNKWVAKDKVVANDIDIETVEHNIYLGQLINMMDDGGDGLDTKRPEKIMRKSSRSLGQRHLKRSRCELEELCTRPISLEGIRNNLCDAKFKVYLLEFRYASSEVVLPTLTQLQTIRRFKEQMVNKDGSIAKKNSDVWTNISESLNYDISSNYAYTSVKMNRYNVHDIFNLPSKVYEPHLHQEGEYVSAESDQDEDVMMKPEERMYKCVDKDKPNMRNWAYHIIPPNSDWTDTINEHFWEHTSLSCALCKSCSSVISGSLQQEPNENTHVLINFKYRGPFVDCSTGSKRILKGTRRRSALEEIVEKNVSACTVRREEARRGMYLGDNEPTHIPTLNALRLTKSRELKSKHVDDDPILAVGKLKYSAEYYSSIREIGLDPFHNHPFPTFASDATGRITAKLKRPFGNLSGVVYLYSVAVHDHEAGVQYTIANILSESHNNLRIHHFLESWLRSGAPLSTSLQSAIDTILDEDNCPKEVSFPKGVENEDETPTDFMKCAHQIILEVKSAIMVPKFGYGSLTSSSAPVESIFNDIKHRTFQNVHLPTTVDRFLANHLRSLDGEMKLVAAIEDGSEEIGNNKLNNSKFKTGIISAHNPKCFACSRGDFPTGAHTCSVCGTPVYAVFSECSIQYGRSEEGCEDSAKENWRVLASLPQRKYIATLIWSRAANLKKLVIQGYGQGVKVKVIGHDNADLIWWPADIIAMMLANTTPELTGKFLGCCGDNGRGRDGRLKCVPSTPPPPIPLLLVCDEASDEIKCQSLFSCRDIDRCGCATSHFLSDESVCMIVALSAWLTIAATGVCMTSSTPHFRWAGLLICKCRRLGAATDRENLDCLPLACTRKLAAIGAFVWELKSLLFVESSTYSKEDESMMTTIRPMRVGNNRRRHDTTSLEMYFRPSPYCDTQNIEYVEAGRFANVVGNTPWQTGSMTHIHRQDRLLIVTGRFANVVGNTPWQTGSMTHIHRQDRLLIVTGRFANVVGNTPWQTGSMTHIHRQDRLLIVTGRFANVVGNTPWQTGSMTHIHRQDRLLIVPTFSFL
ncbi:hypothetical protein PR048_002185 [Dryococelus australis]|uniref:Uncharacterized protein n=1 Tax=Dryococelus australis TaxID=614101 RepID=A0ABQ9IJG3_9NEOP|nr:hypothetical protein PR048_002185 [Dryococelus australis]